VQISVEEQNLSALVSCRRVLDRLVDATADDIRTRRALDQKPCLLAFAETKYRAKSWAYRPA
jgi:hypothetical protein